MMKYERISTHIRENIQSNTMLPNEKLPSLREMADIFCVSIGTVQAAYDSLERENFIYSIPKKGYFVLGTNGHPKVKQQLIDFFSGSPDGRYIPYQDFQQCINKAVNLYQSSMFHYSSPQGMDELIEVMQTHLSNYQVHANKENISIASGSQLVLDILCRMPFPNGKEKVLIEQPAYYGMVKSLEINKTPRVGIARGLKGLDLNELERMFRYDGIKFFYTVSRYHNPTGQSYTKKEMEQIVQLAEKYNVYIVEDDIAADFETSTKRDPLHYFDIYSKVIYIKSFSKILMPGLRIAAVVLPKLLINTFNNYKQWTDTYCPTLSQGALSIYLSGEMFQKHRLAIRDIYMRRMAKLRAVAEEIGEPEIEWSIPDSGFFACLKLKHDVPFEQVQPSFVEYNIRMMDTRNFFLDEFKNNQYYRISISKANEDEIETGVRKLVKILLNYKESKTSYFFEGLGNDAANTIDHTWNHVV